MSQEQKQSAKKTKSITAALNQAFSEFDGNYTRSSSTNRILLLDQDLPYPELNDLTESLTEALPGRMFVVKYSKAEADLSVSAAARCHVIGKGQSVCSEVVDINCGANSLASVPSIINAHLLTGRRIELMLVNNCPRIFELFSDAAELIIFDSQYIWKDTDFLNSMIHKYTRAVDAQWLLLAPWREAIGLYGSAACPVSGFDHLAVAEIHYSVKPEESVRPLLLAGWILSAIEAEPVSGANSEYLCRLPDGRSLLLKLVPAAVNVHKEAAIQAVRFISDTGVVLLDARLKTPSEMSLNMCGKDVVPLSRPFELMSINQALGRYFAVGESTVKYSLAMAKTLDLRKFS